MSGKKASSEFSSVVAQRDDVVYAEPVVHPAGAPPSQTMDPRAVLMQHNIISVVQRIHLVEAFTSWERSNEYDVFSGLVKDGGVRLLEAREESECCQRQCCGANRGFEMDIRGVGGAPIMRLVREFKCTCLCFNRPTMVVKDSTHNGTIGTLYSPFSFCELAIDATNEDGSPMLSIRGSALQPGMCCRCPCGTCKRVVLDVERPGKEAGRIERVWAGCMRAMCDAVDDYQIRIPEDATYQERAVLIAAAIFLDFLYFERKSEKD